MKQESTVEMKDQFQQIWQVTEWVENYKLGGYHPIHIGDYLCKDRYRIVRKLGYGSFSTVWLAKDDSHNHYFAIKVLRAKTSQDSNELQLFQFLKRKGPKGVTSKYILHLLDEFKEVGPNGIHQCFVFDVTGPNLNDFLSSDWADKKRPDHLTLGLMKIISFQIISGVSYLHDMGICHGDLQPGNIVTSLSDIDRIKESELQVDLDSVWNAPPVKRLDGKELDQSTPRYLLTSKPLSDYTNFKEKFAVKITDLGGAFFVSDPPKRILTPNKLRAPEIILGEPVDQSVDIWSLACLLFQIVTSRPLFQVFRWNSTREEEDDDHLVEFVTVLGKLPKNLQSKWRRYYLYYRSNGEQIHSTKDGIYSLREYLYNERPEEMSNEDAESFLSLLQQMLQYDPSKRISASEALKHPWLAN